MQKKDWRWKNKEKTLLRRILVIVFWLVVWQLVAVLVDNSILLVTPVQALCALTDRMVKAAFWKSLLVSFGHIAAGFLWGLSAASFLAILSYRFRWVAELAEPPARLMKTVPVISFIVLLLIWWGSSVLSSIICFLVVFSAIYGNILEGLCSTDFKLLEMAEVFQISGWSRFLYIYRPALYPFVKSGLKLALGMCWKSGVAAEVVGMSADSIGEQLYLSKIYLDTGGVLAWTLVVVLLSVGFEKLVFSLVEQFFRWVPASAHRQKESVKSFPRKKNGQSSPGSGKTTDTGSINCMEVVKCYGEKKVYGNLSVRYPSGEITYLRGISGSGKTTLLRMISGLEQPDSGRILCVGRVSMLFQEDRLCEDYSPIHNVAMVTGNWYSAGRALEKILEKDALERPCRELSGGMKRRVALVRAMEAESDIVLLDEPFTGLDEENRERIWEYMEERRQGRTMLIASHI